MGQAAAVPVTSSGPPLGSREDQVAATSDCTTMVPIAGATAIPSPWSLTAFTCPADCCYPDNPAYCTLDNVLLLLRPAPERCCQSPDQPQPIRASETLFNVKRSKKAILVGSSHEYYLAQKGRRCGLHVCLSVS